MKTKITFILSLVFLIFLISCDDTNYNQGYNSGYNNGKQAGYEQGHEEGYSAGLAEGLSKSNEGYILFDNMNPNLWQVINWISVIAIIISLSIVIVQMIITNIKRFEKVIVSKEHVKQGYYDLDESGNYFYLNETIEYRKVLAKSLVLLLSLLASYLIIPKINLIWFFDPGIINFWAFVIYIVTIFIVYFIGKFLVDLLYSKNAISLEVFIIFITSFFLWFIGYLLINNRYLFGVKPLFGNNLIISITIGIICFLIYSLLHLRIKIK